jgi:hypothetical protein
MAREYLARFECAHQGCREIGYYRASTRKDEADLYRRYGNKQWRCVRHTNPDEVLSETNSKRTFEIASREAPHGRYFGNFGFVSGPGFKAYAKDFPVGTILRVTAEVIPPADSVGAEKTGASQS